MRERDYERFQIKPVFLEAVGAAVVGRLGLFVVAHEMREPADAALFFDQTMMAIVTVTLASDDKKNNQLPLGWSGFWTAS